MLMRHGHHAVDIIAANFARLYKDEHQRYAEEAHDTDIHEYVHVGERGSQLHIPRVHAGIGEIRLAGAV